MNYSKHKCFIFLLFIISITGTPLIAKDLKLFSHGKYNVGFKSSIEYDLSRPAMIDQLKDPSNNGRALQINVWYPTKDISNEQMKFEDYVTVLGDNPITLNEKEAAKQFLFRYNPQFAPYFEPLLNLNISMSAYKNSKFPSVDFPVVVLMHEDPIYYSFLAEYLASNGYVVVNFPVFGSNGIVFDNRTNAVESEVRDIEFAISVIKKLPFIDIQELVLAGFSYGGLSIVSYQMRHQSAKALISFDTGITDSWGVGLIEKMPYYDLEKLTIPILHFWTSNGSWTQNLKWFDIYRYSNRHSIEMSYLRHFDFVGRGILRNYFPDWIEQVQGTALGDYFEGYRTIGKQTLSFLDSVFHNDSTFTVSNKELNEKADYKYFQAIPLPPSYDDLIEIYTSEKIDGIQFTYKSLIKKYSQPISVTTFDKFFKWLEKNAPPIESLTWTTLFKDSYPTSAIAYFRFATVLDKLSRIEESRQAFKKVLELAPLDYTLSRHFRELYISSAIKKLKEK